MHASITSPRYLVPSLTKLLMNRAQRGTPRADPPAAQLPQYPECPTEYRVLQPSAWRVGSRDLELELLNVAYRQQLRSSDRASIAATSVRPVI